MEQPKWTIETVEEWIHIATLVDKSLPPVIHKGVRGQRIEIIREWYELLWDAEEMKKLTPRWEPTAEQVTIWEKVILRWFSLIKDGTNKKIVWLRASGGPWTKIARKVNLSRQTVAKRYTETIENLTKKLNSLDRKIVKKSNTNH